MAETIFDLVVQGPGPEAPALPPAVRALSGAIENTAEGVLRLRSVDPEAAKALLPELDAAGLDAAIVRQGMRLTDFKLVASDLDSTLCATETLDTIAKNAGFGDTVAKVTEAAMRGEIKDYADSLRRRIRAIEGCPIEAFTGYAKNLPFNPGAEALMAAFRAAGLHRYIVTGGFDELAGPAAEHLGAEGYRCNKIEVKDGRLTGIVTGPAENGGAIVDAEGKQRMVSQLCEQLGASPAETIAMGDGWNDVKMLAFAGLGIAYHAKPKVRALIPAQVNRLGLDSILNWFEDGPEWKRKAGF